MSGSVVNLFEESGGTVIAGVVYAANNVTVVSDSSITLVTPSVIQAASFYVTVLTPGGTSAYSSSSIFTYSPLVPTVLSVSPTSGSASGELSW